jgi:hypothetical protein
MDIFTYFSRFFNFRLTVLVAPAITVTVAVTTTAAVAWIIIVFTLYVSRPVTNVLL